ncbi:uncharacterized protein LOC135143570 isoform X2 [Zophobas morio]|uniref:uncharacterized protein LOC135143570 isoform X2 n=1 Tax=Zophobas morio TaxID=2755281 RepID=UPI0030827AB5
MKRKTYTRKGTLKKKGDAFLISSESKPEDFISTLYFRNLVLNINEYLLQRNFTAALDVLQVLLHCYDKVPEIIWKAGLEILNRFQKERQQCLFFFRRLLSLRVANADKETIILEIFFFHLSEGKPTILQNLLLLEGFSGEMEEAYETLRPFLTLEPYFQNPKFHGYAGMACTSLWFTALKKSSQRSSLEPSPSSTWPCSFPGCSSQSSLERSADLYFRSALEHFETCFKLPNAYQKSFVLYYFRLLEHENNKNGIENLLNKLRRDEPKDIFWLKCSIAFLLGQAGMESAAEACKIDFFACNGSAREDSLLEVVFSSRVLELVEELHLLSPTDSLLYYFLETNAPLSPMLQFAVVLSFLDYEKHSCGFLWGKLIQLLLDADQKQVLNQPAWKMRKDWWPEMKFSLPIANDLQELACRAACAFYFLGSNDYTNKAFEIFKNFKESHFALENCQQVGFFKFTCKHDSANCNYCHPHSP